MNIIDSIHAFTCIKNPIADNFTAKRLWRNLKPLALVSPAKWLILSVGHQKNRIKTFSVII